MKIYENFKNSANPKYFFQNFPSDYTVSDTYDVMKIIKETYGDADFDNIYLLGFESTSINGKISNPFPVQGTLIGPMVPVSN